MFWLVLLLSFCMSKLVEKFALHPCILWSTFRLTLRSLLSTYQRSSVVQVQLQADVQQVLSTGKAFAALMTDGSIGTWRIEK